MNLPIACQAAANTDVLTNGGCLTTNVVDAGPGIGASLTEVKISKDAALEYHYVPILVTLTIWSSQMFGPAVTSLALQMACCEITLTVK